MLSPSPPHREYISLITNVIALPSPPRVYQFNNSQWGGEGDKEYISGNMHSISNYFSRVFLEKHRVSKYTVKLHRSI